MSVQFSSATQSHLTLCDPMNRSTPGLPVHHQLLESTQVHVHQVGDAIQPSYPLSSPSPPALNLFQHQGPFKWVSSSHQVAKVLNCNFKTTEKPTSAFQCCVAFYFYLFIATIASLIFWFLLQWTRINEILCFRMAFLLCIINFYFMCLHYFIVLRYFIIA